MVTGLQLGVEYVSRAAQKEDRGMTVGRRHQLNVLVGDDNIKCDRKKKICRFLTSNYRQIEQKFRNVQYKFCHAISPVRVIIIIIIIIIIIRINGIFYIITESKNNIFWLAVLYGCEWLCLALRIYRIYLK